MVAARGIERGPGDLTTLHAAGCPQTTWERCSGPPRAPVRPGRGVGRTAPSCTQLQGGKPGAFRADTSLLQG